jgi:preprotein translocase subunit SecF
MQILNSFQYRKVAYGISVVVLILGIGSLINGFDEGVEFKGGRSYTILFDKAYKTSEVAEALKPVFGDFPIIKTVGTAKPVRYYNSLSYQSNRSEYRLNC